MRNSARHKPREGFTVSEVLVSLGILAVVMYLVTAVVSGSYQVSSASQKRLQAIQHARAALEKVKNTPLSRFPPEEIRVKEDQSQTFQLRQRPVLEGSLELTWDDGSAFEGDYELDAERGELTMKNPERSGTLHVNYSVLLQVSEDSKSPSDFRSSVRATNAPDGKAKLITVRTQWNNGAKTHSVELHRLRAW